MLPFQLNIDLYVYEVAFTEKREDGDWERSSREVFSEAAVTVLLLDPSGG